MTILITGGAGFLGSNLCARLIVEGHNVICVDSLITGQKKNIQNLLSNPNFSFIEHDIIQPLDFQEKIDQIYHAASPASPHPTSKKSYHQLPFETMQVNTTGTWNLCELALKHNASLLYFSTSECYGDPLEHPQREEYRGNVSTTGPRSVYDEAKRFGETIVAAFTRSKGLDGKIIRIFNTYGPNMATDDGRVVTEFITHALQNKPLPIFGTGKGTRSLCYVDDLIEGIIRVMNSAETKGQIVNLGNPDEYTILELAEIIIKKTDSASTLNYIKIDTTDIPEKRRPDITKAKSLLQWEPKVTLEAGLEKMIAYVTEELNVPQFSSKI